MGKRYVRFMGIEEIRKYLRGEKLENHRKWIWGSVGFCFFDMTVKPEERIEYLRGVATMGIVAEFERISKTPMREAWGQYRDPEKDNIFSFQVTMERVKEYSVEEYNQDAMRLVRVGYVADPWDRKIAWMEETE